MHEILSHVYLAIERDLLQHGEEEETGGTAKLLDSAFLSHDSYAIFEAIMTNLAPAYDADLGFVPASPMRQSPMELMGSSILQKIRTVAADEELFRYVSEMTVPPQLYCTRWVRLMFSREVLGWDNVVLLWDVFFDQITIPTTSSDDNDMSTPTTLMDVLESTAASMILLIRDKLLPQSVAPTGQPDRYHDPNDSINVLMNYPPLKDATLLVDVLMSMMLQQRQQHQQINNPHQPLQQQQPQRQPVVISGKSDDQTTKISNVTASANRATAPTATTATTAKTFSNDDPLASTPPSDTAPISINATERRSSMHQQHHHHQQQLSPPNNVVDNAMASMAKGLRGALDTLDRTIENVASNVSKEIQQMQATTNNNNNPEPTKPPLSDSTILQYKSKTKTYDGENRRRSVQIGTGGAVMAAAATPAMKKEESFRRKSYDQLLLRMSEEISIKDFKTNHVNHVNHVQSNSFSSGMNLPKSTSATTATTTATAMNSEMVAKKDTMMKMATQLESSMNTIRTHLKEKVITKDVDPMGVHKIEVDTVPKVVWDAIDDIETVRKNLIQAAKNIG